MYENDHAGASAAPANMNRKRRVKYTEQVTVVSGDKCACMRLWLLWLVVFDVSLSFVAVHKVCVC